MLAFVLGGLLVKGPFPNWWMLIGISGAWQSWTAPTQMPLGLSVSGKQIASNSSFFLGLDFQPAKKCRIDFGTGGCRQADAQLAVNNDALEFLDEGPVRTAGFGTDIKAG